MGATMSHEIEIGTRIDGEPVPLATAGVQTTAHKLWLSLGIALIATVALLATGIWSRIRAGKTLRTETSQVATMAVSIVLPKQSAPAQEIILPGNVEPFINSPIYSRTNGYLKAWYADIGTHVKKGQLLAVI